MQQMKVSVKTDKIRESKKIIKEELIDNPVIIKKMRDLNCSEKEFDEYLGYFLVFHSFANIIFYRFTLWFTFSSKYNSFSQSHKICAKSYGGIFFELHSVEKYF